MKFGSKKAIFGVICGGFEGFGPCLGISHPTHPHLGEISQKNVFFFLGGGASLSGAGVHLNNICTKVPSDKEGVDGEGKERQNVEGEPGGDSV